MDGLFLVPLAPFLFVLGIIWLVNNRKLEEKRIAAAAAAGSDSSASNAAAERIEELEDRVRVLERIVTDGGYDLATRIEALRDDRGMEQRLGAAELREKI